MKNKCSKTLILLGLVLPMICIAGCKDNTSSSSDVVDDSSVAITSYKVTLPTGKGFTVSGAKTVYEGSDYNFSIFVSEGYDGSEMVVKANGTTLISEDDNYTVKDVHSDIVIEVSGVYQKSSISLVKSSFRFNIDRISEEAKTKSYYLEGVTGQYRGENVTVDVDISSVDFTKCDEYVIRYFLVEHPEVKANAIVSIYELPEVNNVTIDLSHYKQEFISYDLGEANTDFFVKDADGNVLGSDQILFDANEEINYLSFDYIKTLPVNSALTYTLIIAEDEITFILTITDNEDPLIAFSKEAGEYAYLSTESVILPTAAVAAGSAQRIDFKYFLDGEEIEPNPITLAKGNHEYTIKSYREGVEFDEEYQRTYTFVVLDDYLLHSDTDLNSNFLYYNNQTFGTAIKDCEIISSNANTRNATIVGQSFKVSNEIITLAKDQGYNYMRLTMFVTSDDGNAINGIPYTSTGHTVKQYNPDKGKEEDVFWREYYQENGYSKYASIVVPIGEIDLVTYPNTAIQFHFRTAESNGNDVKSTAVISNITFSIDAIGPEVILGDPAWSAESGEMEVLSMKDPVYKASFTDMSYNWHRALFSGMAKIYQQYKYRSVEIECSGHEHDIYVFQNTSRDLPSGYVYGATAFKGGVDGKLVMNINNLDVLGFMTSHARTGIPGGQDEDGTYGFAETFTLTLTFHVGKDGSDEPEEEVVPIETFGDWYMTDEDAYFTKVDNDEENGIFSFKVNQLTFMWKSVVYSGLSKMYEAGHKYVKVSVNGNKHSLVVYRGDITDPAKVADGYTYQISAGGGSVTLDVADFTYLGIMTTRSIKGLSDDDPDGVTGGKFENMTVTVKFYSELGLVDEFGEGKAWSNLNGGTAAADDRINGHKITATWQMELSIDYMSRALAKGYKSLEFDFQISSKLVGGQCDYLQNSDGRYYETDEDGVGHIVVDLTLTKFWIRGKLTPNSSYGSDIQSCSILIYNAKLLETYTDPEAQSNAIKQLNGILSSESSFWRYVHHNGWGQSYNDTLTDNNTYTDGKVYFWSYVGVFTLQPELFSDMKLAGYTHFKFNLVINKAHDTDPNVDKMDYISTNTSLINSSVDMTYDADGVMFDIDLTELLKLESFSGIAINFYARNNQTGDSEVETNFVMSNVSYQ